MSALKDYALARVGVIAPKPFNFELNEQDERTTKKSKYDWQKLIDSIDGEEYDYYCNAETIETGDEIADAINDIMRDYDYGMANYIVQAQFHMSICHRP